MRNSIKRLAIIAISIVLVLAPSVSAKGQQDAAILAPVLEWWQNSQLGQMALDAERALDGFAAQLEGVESMSKTVGFMRDASGKIRDAYAIKSAIETLYHQNRGLYEDCVYAHNWSQQKLLEGNLKPTDALMLSLLTESIYKRAYNNLSEILTLIDSKNSGLTLNERLEKIIADARQAKLEREAINAIIASVEEDIKDQSAGEYYSAYLKTAFGTSKIDSDDSYLKGFYLPTKKEAREIVALQDKASEEDEESQPIINSDNGAKLKEATKEVVESGSSVLNIVTLIIGLLAIIMSLPTLYRVNHGEQQSKDVLYKLIMGTIAIIFIIQVFGRLILSL